MTALASTHAADTQPAWIDAHVHVWTPDTARYPLAPTFQVADMKPASFTPEELMQHAQPTGIGRVVLIQMSFYRYDNSYMLDTIQRFPGVYRGVAVIDVDAADPAATMRSLKAQGVRGFRLAPFANDPAKWFGRPGIEAMWRCGAAENLKMCLLINPNAFPVVDDFCRRHPDTPVVIDHFARIGADGTIRDSDVAALSALARHRQVTVKTSAMYALGKKQMPYDDLKPLMRRMLDAFGPERLMWASDCPFQVQEGHTYASSVEFITQRCDFLSASDREHVLRKTAERVFFA